MNTLGLNTTNYAMAPIDFAKEYGLDYIQQGDLYIMYSKEYIIEAFSALRERFACLDTEGMRAFRGSKADLSAKIDKAETIALDLVDNHLEEVFPYVPLTRQAKFSKNKSVLLYAFEIVATYNQDYFSQNEICLRLDPVEYISKKPGDAYSKYYDNILILELNDNCVFSKKRPSNMFDEKGWHGIETKKESYIKQPNLKVGSSYLDAKDTEYLFLGYAAVSATSVSKTGGLYLRLTDKFKEQIASFSTLYDFISAYIKEKQIQNRAKSEDGTDLEWKDGLNETNSKKFLTLANTFFDDEHIGYDEPLMFEFRYPDYNSRNNTVLSSMIKIEFCDK